MWNDVRLSAMVVGLRTTPERETLEDSTEQGWLLARGIHEKVGLQLVGLPGCGVE
jgi:hypothetical protein